MIAELFAFLLSLELRSVLIVYFLLQALGVYFASKAIVQSRTPQGAVAWLFFLLSFPFIGVFAFILFGKRKFEGYVASRRRGDKRFRDAGVAPTLFDKGSKDSGTSLFHELSKLVRMPVTKRNQFQILASGDQFFESLFSEIEKAEKYVFLEFYLLRGDRLGSRLRDLLVKKRAQGVRVYFLYDRVGSFGLSDQFTQSLRRGDCEVHAFLASKNPLRKFQINFRNHRKIVVVDGRVAFTGGMNIGEEYARGSKNLGPWRDLQVRVEGPAVSYLQWSFLENWFWVTGETPTVSWNEKSLPSSEENRAVIVPTSPADVLDTGLLLVLSLIESAQSKIQITTPYFVPDEAIISSMQRASLRGVKMEVIVPRRSDSWLVDWALFSFGKDLEGCGVEFFQYQKGFLHQKMILIDDSISYVGTSNMDNRSFRLNFEVGIVVDSKQLTAELRALFEKDLLDSKRIELDKTYQNRSLVRLKASFARLFSPLL